MQHDQLVSQIIQDIRSHLSSDEFLEEYRFPNHFVRSRKLTMRTVAMFLLFHCKHGLDLKLAKFRDELPELEVPVVTKQAISKARQGINPRLFYQLFRTSVDSYYKDRPIRKTWRNSYSLFAIDGSDFEVPNSPSNFEEFGEQSDPKNPGAKWSMALASTLYDILEDKVVDATVQYQYQGERELAVFHLGRLADLKLQANAIVIFDRGYYSADVFQECVNTGCFCLMRLKEAYTNLCGHKEDDAKVTILAPDKKTKMEARVIRVALPNGKAEYLITNLMDSNITPEEFRELYFERWKIETKYYELKEFWRIEEFTGETAVSVRQDFFITMLYANLASIIKSGADEIIEKQEKATNIYKYRATRTFIAGRVQTLFIRWVNKPFQIEDVDKLILDASKSRSPVQPGRTRPRKRSTRAKKHYSNRRIIC